jgi:hypothetical protein
MRQVYWLAVLMLSTSYNSIIDKQSKMIPRSTYYSRKAKVQNLKMFKDNQGFLENNASCSGKSSKKRPTC